MGEHTLKWLAAVGDGGLSTARGRAASPASNSIRFAQPYTSEPFIP
jgi:hypothetical protein